MRSRPEYFGKDGAGKDDAGVENMQIFQIISFILLCFLFSLLPAYAAEVSLEKVLPSPACAPGWVMDEKVTLYNKDTLFDRIDGEAELYFPYGFEMLASARYASKQNPQIAVDADIYKMGSLLDAFGMYANYRRKDDADIKIGAEGTVSPSQLFFYQGRYLVRLQVTGATSLGQDVLLACARSITHNLPAETKRPKELEALMMPSVVQKSERYIAQSLLGYDFFRRGLMADTVLKGEEAQVFVVLEDSQDAARKALEQYRENVKTSGKDVRVTETQGRISLKAVDSLYGNVLVTQVGRHLVGAIRFKNTSLAEQLVDQIRKRLGN
jgi:hypothetical protein